MSPATSSLFIDLETLNTTPDSVITEIGAVRFYPDKNLAHDPRTFSREPSIPHQLTLGRTFSADTIRYHHSKKSMRQDWFGPTLKECLADLAHFIRLEPFNRIWIWGKDFDRPILEHAFAQAGLDMPFTPWITKCARDTWDNAFPGVKHAKRPHRAVEDCLASISDLRAAAEKLDIELSAI